jgi:hypothetical protein
MQPEAIEPVPKRISSAWRIRSRRTSRSAGRFLTHLRFAEFSAAASRKLAALSRGLLWTRLSIRVDSRHGSPAGIISQATGVPLTPKPRTDSHG